MVYRIYVEKKAGLDLDAQSLKKEINNLLQIKELTALRLINRYDVENIEKTLFDYSVKAVFSEPQLDDVYGSLTEIKATHSGKATVFAVEYLPGQFDQRADSAAQCIQLVSQQNKPTVRTARVYLLYGDLTVAQVDAIKKHVINPVESRLASLDEYATLVNEYVLPDKVETLDGFIGLDAKGLTAFIKKYALAMDLDDITFCQAYFINEKRDPTLTEIRMIDTYWSDHCRHTTFLTTLDEVKIDDDEIQKTYDEYLSVRSYLNRTKPINLMDMATLAVKYLKATGKLDKLDESEEINACTVKMKVDVDGVDEDWLLLFKNETHNHPTEIEPFGGAATCIGGAIRDPLSGRAYVYAAMRVTGAGNPLTPVGDTIKGKLPQRKIVATAAAGYSSYGNQIGLATGQVDEIYHEGYVAKRMEIGAVIAAAPEKNVVRERPVDGDIVILLGGRTGRDGCGGATGSSKSHTLESLETCGAEVQKGNAPEERKLQRLFRSEEAARLIKRCNDFGAGGVSVAIGELADGLDINLDAVPKKYEGLDGTELAISESQERMAVVVDKNDADSFMALASAENLEASIVACVKDEPRLTMFWKGNKIVDVTREFLNSNGAEKHIKVHITKPEEYSKPLKGGFTDSYFELAGDLNVCSKRGLSERFDSTIGANTVLMPFGGKNQITPSQAMAHTVSVEKGRTTTCSLMAYGYNPYVFEKNQYNGAYLSVVESVSKLVASGAKFEDVYLTFQEYFEKPFKEAERWGKPAAALLGAFKAQKDLSIGAIGGKDSMSGTFEHIDVPPTLVSFAVTTEKVSGIISPEFKRAGSRVYLLAPDYNKNGLPDTMSLLSVFATVNKNVVSGNIISAYTTTYGGIAEAVMKMCFGNSLGFTFTNKLSLSELFGYNYGAFVVEAEGELSATESYKYVLLGETNNSNEIRYDGECVSLNELLRVYESKLEEIYPCNIEQSQPAIQKLSYNAGVKQACSASYARPRVLIPVFPGTNCEYDTAKALRDAGAEPEIFVIKNLTSKDVAQSVEVFADKLKNSQMVFVPGGFSGGDEPDGSAKFITAFFRNASIKNEVRELLKTREGLIGGICNGFQALIKLGLVLEGDIIDVDENCPTLTFNSIGRHQSRIVLTRICSNLSPWLSGVEVGDIINVAISHGEGRFIANEAWLEKLKKNGQIATQYVDIDGNPTANVRFNPNNSVWAIEGITSPDGRVFGKMGHSERVGNGLYKNVYGNYDIKMFASAVKYFK